MLSVMDMRLTTEVLLEVVCHHFYTMAGTDACNNGNSVSYAVRAEML
jgi:hypothetical protein